jgi:hypothetical protein
MSARLAWPLFGLWVVATGTSAVLQASQGDGIDAAIAPALAIFAGTGALIAARRPDNPIGLILLCTALLITLSGLLEGIYADDTEQPAPSLALRLLVWVDQWLFFVWVGLIGIALPLLFPDGRLVSRRWRVFAGVGATVVAVGLLAEAFGEQRIAWGEDGTVANPLAAPGALGAVARLAGDAGGPLFALVMLGSLGSVVVRWRGSTGLRRQQFKWFGFAVALLLLGLALAAVGEEIPPIAIVGDIGWWLFILATLAGVPVAIGVAVLKHRLYDIDIVIRRTLVYGALTATLGGTYLLLALLIGLTLGESDVAVAASTLAVAALFRPARARIQAAVDRRFYRRRFDATQTLEAFGARLRDELDLETLAADLRGVVQDTVQPAHVSLWLRSAR